MRRRLAEAQLAFMLLTRLPAGPIATPVPATGAAMWAWPLAGLVPGGLAALALSAAPTLGDLPAALVAVTLSVMVTGALHEDGLADFADGVGGGWDRARALEIMRDSRIGSFGTLALVLSVGIRAASLAALGPLVALAAAVVSRAAMAPLAALLPPARTDGMGHGAAGPARRRLAAALAIGGICAILLLGATGLALALAALAGAALVGLVARVRLGGQTGDVLGAAQQSAEIAALLVALALT